MRVLLTGASSFTGFWFARALKAAGHHIVATFRQSEGDYKGLRGERVKALANVVEPFWNVEFGDSRFLDLATSDTFDVFLHHAAEMNEYRSWDFDPIAALTKNTRSARDLLTRLQRQGCNKLIFTGSVFEPYEGIGDRDRRSFNPYGLSKHLSFELFRMEAEKLGLSVGKFVIPNPFGPQEEMRFIFYLAKEWAAGRTPIVSTPTYIRDNIHVSLLALSYCQFCETLSASPGVIRLAPSGYVESQGSFARRTARELGARTGWACTLAEADQTEFPEPLFRTNSEQAAPTLPTWSEVHAWDSLAEFYLAITQQFNVVE